MNCEQVESDKMNQEQVERHAEESLEKSLKEKNDEEESDEVIYIFLEKNDFFLVKLKNHTKTNVK